MHNQIECTGLSSENDKVMSRALRELAQPNSGARLRQTKNWSCACHLGRCARDCVGRTGIERLWRSTRHWKRSPKWTRRELTSSALGRGPVPSPPSSIWLVQLGFLDSESG